jgi:hypothetical protein
MPTIIGFDFRIELWGFNSPRAKNPQNLFSIAVAKVAA